MKLAVIFPGIGYHTDKPILYYAKKMAGAFGYEIREVSYGNFPDNVKGSEERMTEAFASALSWAEEILKEVDFSRYDGLLFISKSIGTAVASAYAQRRRLSPYHIYYTPVKETFSLATGEGVVFHGTNDPFAETDFIKNACRERKLPLFMTENGNHSLETGDVLHDLKNLERIMEETRSCLEKLEAAGSGLLRID